MGATCQCFSNKKGSSQQQNKAIINLQPNTKPTLEVESNPYFQVQNQQKSLNKPLNSGADGSKLSDPSRVDAKLQQTDDRIRRSKVSASKLHPVSKNEWVYQKNGSKIIVNKSQVTAAENSHLVQHIPSQELKGKIVSSFAVKVAEGRGDLARDSNYLDDSLEGLQNLIPTADRSLGNFQIEDMRGMQVAAIKTYLFDRKLAGRLID